MDTSNLQTFVTLAETTSFSETAERLFVTQPAVSKRIASLEQELDFKLFDRINRSARLTAAGQALLPQAREILAGMNRAKATLTDLKGAVAGTLSIGISHHIGLHRLPPILREFTKRYPDVELDIRFMDSELAHQAIVDGELELAVITLAPKIESPLTSFEVWPDPLAVMVGLEHPLAKQSNVTLEHLCEHTALPPGLGTYTGRMIRALFEERGLKMQYGLSTNYLETIKVMVSVGLGWSILPKTLFDDSVVALKTDFKLSRQLGCVHHQSRTKSNAADAFITLLKHSRKQKRRGS